MMNIQTKAYGERKPKKKEVQDIIKTLYSEPCNENYRDDLARVYKYFMPAATKKPKTVFDWLWLAVGKEATRPHLNFIWCDGKGNAVATNGHRLHKAPCDKPEGFYDREGNKIDVNLTFPIHDFAKQYWERIFPDDAPLFEEGFKINDISLYQIEGVSFGFNMTYFDQAKSFGDCDFKAFWSKDNNPLRFVFDDGREALVMPIRL